MISTENIRFSMQQLFWASGLSISNGICTAEHDPSEYNGVVEVTIQDSLILQSSFTDQDELNPFIQLLELADDTFSKKHKRARFIVC